MRPDPSAPPQADDEARPSILAIMGVSGSGKSTVGALLAARLRLSFLDADDLHSPDNISKMRSGVALTDADREGWLNAVASHIASWQATGDGGVLACSALKRLYRKRLFGDGQDVQLIYLRAPIEVVRRRLQMRQGHFMPPSLVESQFETLEEPLAEEGALTVEADSPQQAAEAIVTALTVRQLSPATSSHATAPETA